MSLLWDQERRIGRLAIESVLHGMVATTELARRVNAASTRLA